MAADIPLVSSREQLLVEVEALRARLDEAEETLRAIQHGEVDALVISGPQGRQVFTLKGAEQPYRILIEEMNEGAVTLTSGGLILYCNRRFAQMVRAPLERVIGADFRSFVAPAQAAAFTALLEAAFTLRSSGDIAGQTADGLPLPLHLSLNWLPDTRPATVCAVVTDLTERRAKEEELQRARQQLELRVAERTAWLAQSNRDLEAARRSALALVEESIAARRQAENAAAALRDSEQRFRSTVEAAPYAIFIQTHDCFAYLNPAALELFGAADAGQLIGQPVMERFHPDLMPIVAERIRILRDERQTVPTLEEVFLTLDGTPMDVEVSAVPFTFQGERGALVFARDIRARKRAAEEIRALNADLERRVHERTASLEAANTELEAFNYSVSHDLRAPLRAIHGYSRILVEDYADHLDAEGRRLLAAITAQTQRMGKLIEDLLVFSRLGRQSLARSVVDMTVLAREIFEEQAGRQPQRHVQLALKPLPAARGDQAMLRVALGNLVSNAIKFTAGRDPAQIDIDGRRENGQAIYTVADNGVGFDMQHADRLFGVFQRLHPTDQFEGTGIGLALVQRIIQRHGGQVWAEGRVGAGATFYFSLPDEETGP